jgi:hypothetical protein
MESDLLRLNLNDRLESEIKSKYKKNISKVKEFINKDGE